jgi:hypothetical protein
VRNRETHRESTTARSRMTGASPGPGWEEGLVGGGVRPTLGGLKMPRGGGGVKYLDQMEHVIDEMERG